MGSTPARSLLTALAVTMVMVACGGGRSSTGTSTTASARPPATSSTTTNATDVTYSAPDPTVCPRATGNAGSRAPAPLTGLEGGSGGGSGETSVSWSAPAGGGIVCYRVYRANTATGPFVLAAVIRVDASRIVAHPDAANRIDPTVELSDGRLTLTEYALYVPTGLGGCCFYYRVTAVDAAGNESRASKAVCAADVSTSASGQGCGPEDQ